MPQTGFNWSWSSQGMKPTATPENERRPRWGSPFARGTLQTGLRQPLGAPPEDDDELTDDELAELDKVDPQLAAEERAKRDAGRQKARGQALPATIGTPGRGQGPPGPQQGIGYRPADLGEAPGPTLGKFPEPPTGYSQQVTVTTVEGPTGESKTTKVVLTPKEAAKLPPDTVGISGYYKDIDPDSDMRLLVLTNAAGNAIGSRIVSKPPDYLTRVQNAKYPYPWMYPGSVEALTRKGNEAMKGYYTQQGQFLGYGESMEPWPGTEPKKEWQGVYKRGNREFLARFREGQTDPLEIGREITPPEKPQGQWYPLPGSEKTMTVMPGAERPDKTVNDTGSPEEVNYREVRNNLTGEQKGEVTSKRKATEAAYWGMRQEAEISGQQQAVVEERQAEQQRRLAAQAAYDRSQAMSQPRNWITSRPNPIVPANLARIIGQPAGQPVKPVAPPMPSAQQWAMMSSTDKEMFMGFLQWVGIDPEQWLIDLNKQWNVGSRVPASVVWATPRQR